MHFFTTIPTITTVFVFLRTNSAEETDIASANPTPPAKCKQLITMSCLPYSGFQAIANKGLFLAVYQKLEKHAKFYFYFKIKSALIASLNLGQERHFHFGCKVFRIWAPLTWNAFFAAFEFIACK